KKCVARRNTDEEDPRHLQREPAHQDVAPAVAVHDEARGRLWQRGEHVEHGQHEPEGGVRDAERLLHQREERREHELVEMAQRVAQPDEADDDRVFALPHAFFLANAAAAASVFSGWSRNGAWPQRSSLRSSQGPFTLAPISSSCAMVPYSSS